MAFLDSSDQQASPPAVAASGDEFLSIRSACDRCRVHKLKCVVPAASDGRGPCERCTRASLTCVFGRRRRAARLAGYDSNKKSSETGPLHSPITTPASTTAPPCESWADHTGTISTIDNGSNLSVSLGPRTTTAYPGHPWEGPAALCNALDEGPIDFGAEPTAYDCLNPGSGLGNLYVLDADQPLLSLPAQWSPESTALVAPRPTIGSEGSVTSSGLVQELLGLMSEMQQRLRMLEAGPWQHDNGRALDDYPIGTVLYLSQKFGTIAGPVLSAAGGDKRPKAQSPGSDASVDTPTTLLILSGYMWLMRIYSIVLSHFQTHLSRMPGHQQGRALVGNEDTTNPTLQLGELPCASGGLGLVRIHTAVCLLLDSLNKVEEQAGKGGVLARDLVMALLKQDDVMSSSFLQHDSVHLSRKASAVKGLLREKMGL
ncbi:Fungal zn(2)-Cys(6) binuclear cluster domain-containing protein [Pleurostoma richardsiae]|uniref:Fungal zn(2)-Cys(6) binuclear cluster domain-containing protein n=1 Tax=Pleurostoma richardsiae TaxID=41990 RepID=A0AA38RLC5_9PEZI|nr:Fungal zn(2)-Cys(6) binuclear cluster domain-containing protein [Pleurostoma richardsiae]